MARTRRELAAAMAASGWHLETADREGGKTGHRWTMVHVASNSSVSFQRLAEVEEMGRQLCRLQRLVDGWSRTVARWHERGKGAPHELCRAWLASDEETVPVRLFHVLASLPKPGESRQWFRDSASMTIVSPPGGHDLLGTVRAHVAGLQQRRLDKALGSVGRKGYRQRL